MFITIHTSKGPAYLNVGDIESVSSVPVGLGGGADVARVDMKSGRRYYAKHSTEDVMRMIAQARR